MKEFAILKLGYFYRTCIAKKQTMYFSDLQIEVLVI